MGKEAWGERECDPFLLLWGYEPVHDCRAEILEARGGGTDRQPFLQEVAQTKIITIINFTNLTHSPACAAPAVFKYR